MKRVRKWMRSALLVTCDACDCVVRSVTGYMCPQRREDDVAVHEMARRLDLELRSPSSFERFMLGLTVGFLLVLLISIGAQVWAHHHRTPVDKALDNLRSAIIEVQEALR